MATPSTPDAPPVASTSAPVVAPAAVVVPSAPVAAPVVAVPSPAPVARKRGVTVKDVAPYDFITAYARHLKRTRKIAVPEWADYVKTSHRKELPPNDQDWFYIRCAAVARKVYLRPGNGVGSLRKAFGGSKRNGTKPNTFALASGSVVRAAFKALESIKVIEKDAKSGGRKITATGQRDLDRIAGQVHKQ